MVRCGRFASLSASFSMPVLKMPKVEEEKSYYKIGRGGINWYRTVHQQMVSLKFCFILSVLYLTFSFRECVCPCEHPSDYLSLSFLLMFPSEHFISFACSPRFFIIFYLGLLPLPSSSGCRGLDVSTFNI